MNKIFTNNAGQTDNLREREHDVVDDVLHRFKSHGRPRRRLDRQVMPLVHRLVNLRVVSEHVEPVIDGLDKNGMDLQFLGCFRASKVVLMGLP